MLQFIKYTLLFLILLFVATTALFFTETWTTRYDTYQDAKRDQLFLRGWLPDVLPSSAHSIAETHDIDTNKLCAEAVIPQSSIRPVSEKLLDLSYSRFEENLPALPDFNRLGIIDCTFGIDQISNNRITYHKISDGLFTFREIIVLDKENEKFYIWSY